MKIAYLDCFSGISGDMFLGALLDAGLPFIELKEVIRTLPLRGYHLQRTHEKRNNLSGTRLIVELTDHDEGHRTFKDIKKILLASDLSEWVKGKSLDIFQSLAEEEGKIHGIDSEMVRFHEVGALDSIIDIVGTAFGVERLGLSSLTVSALPLGSGFTDTAHGTIPIPAPATLALLKDIPVYSSGSTHEMVTPTGAALVKVLASSFGSMPPMKIQQIGYGVGSRNLPDRPNLLRLIIGKTQVEPQTETIVVMETNLDDMNPEWLGYLMDRLLGAGALDVIFCPVQMKKNRPGILVQVLGMPDQRDKLTDILFHETTTLGIRYHLSRRAVLRRTPDELESPWGRLGVKKVERPDGRVFYSPEYESCRTLAHEKGIPLRDIYRWVTSFGGKNHV